MDLMAELDRGITARRFFVLANGLSPDSVWRLWRRDRPRFLEGDAAEAYFGAIG